MVAGASGAVPWATIRLGPPVARILVTDLDGELTLYDVEGDLVYTLNSTASEIWRLMDGEHDLDDVVEVLATAYAVDSDEIRPYVLQTVSTFVDRDLVSVGGGA